MLKSIYWGLSHSFFITVRPNSSYSSENGNQDIQLTSCQTFSYYLSHLSFSADKCFRKGTNPCCICTHFAVLCTVRPLVLILTTTLSQMDPTCIKYPNFKLNPAMPFLLCKRQDQLYGHRINLRLMN